MSRLGSGFLFPIQFTVDSGCAASMGHVPTIANQWQGSYKDMANPSSYHMASGWGVLQKVGRSFKRSLQREGTQRKLTLNFSLEVRTILICGPAVLILFLQGYFSSVY